MKNLFNLMQKIKEIKNPYNLIKKSKKLKTQKI